MSPDIVIVTFFFVLVGALTAMFYVPRGKSKHGRRKPPTVI